MSKSIEPEIKEIKDIGKEIPIVKQEKNYRKPSEISQTKECSSVIINNNKSQEKSIKMKRSSNGENIRLHELSKYGSCNEIKFTIKTQQGSSFAMSSLDQYQQIESSKFKHQINPKTKNLILEVIESSTIAEKTKITITPSGLIDSQRKSQDGYVYFGSESVQV